MLKALFTTLLLSLPLFSWENPLLPLSQHGDRASDSLAIDAIINELTGTEERYYARLNDISGLHLNSEGRAIRLMLSPLVNFLRASGAEIQRLSITPAIGDLNALKILEIKDFNLTTLPKELGKLQNLETLILENHAFTDFPFDPLHFKKLQQLSLRNCNISEIPTTIGALQSLVVLNMPGNPKAEFPENIKDLKSLKNINVNGCGLSELPKELGTLPNLQWIAAEENQLSSLPETLREHLKLSQIDLNSNNFETFPEVLFSLPNLKVIGLQKNVLPTLPEAVTKLPMEIGLYIGQNPIKTTSLSKEVISWLDANNAQWKAELTQED